MAGTALFTALSLSLFLDLPEVTERKVPSHQQESRMKCPNPREGFTQIPSPLSHEALVPLPEVAWLAEQRPSSTSSLLES